MKRVLVFFILLVALLSGLLWYELREREQLARGPSGGSGTIEGTEVAIVARISSRIKEIRVQEGDAVQEGDLLVLRDCTEQQALLQAAEAGLQGAHLARDAARVASRLAEQSASTSRNQLLAAEAGARATEAQREALRLQQEAAARAAQRVAQALQTGATSAQLLDTTQTQAAGLAQQLAAAASSSQAAAQQAAATAGVARAAGLQIEAARVKLQGSEVEIQAAAAARSRAAALVAECSLTAPRTGTVQTRSAEVGEVVLPGSRLLTLVDTREVKAVFYLPNAELAAARPGAPVEVTPDALPTLRFAGTVRHVGVSAEFTPRNVQTREDRDRLVYAVEVAIPNPEGLLRPGMPVEIRLPGTERP